MEAKRSKKILLLIDSLGTGGAQTQILNLAHGLQSQGYSILLLTYFDLNKRGDFLKKHQIEHICIKKNSRFNLSPVRSILKIVKEYGIDVAISFLFTPSVYLLLAGLYNTKLRIIVSERTGEGNVTKLNKISRFLYLRADVITANSATQTHILKNKLSIIKSRITYIPNCVVKDNTDKIVAVNQDSLVLKICAIGRIVPLKNYEVIINAINKVKETVDVKLDIYGKTFPEFKLYFEGLLNLVEKYELQNNVIIKGEVPNIQENLPNYDLLVHASHIEGFPNVICEALSYGVPVIATNISDVPSIIKENHNGFLFSPDDSTTLANKIVDFYNLSPEKKQALMANAQETVELNFSLQKYSNNYIELIER